jgi:hypothetical protein
MMMAAGGGGMPLPHMQHLAQQQQQQPRKAVPTWLQQEILKRKAEADRKAAQQAARKARRQRGSDSDTDSSGSDQGSDGEPAERRAGKAQRTSVSGGGGSRWGGDEEGTAKVGVAGRGPRHGSGAAEQKGQVEEEEEEEAAAAPLVSCRPCCHCWKPTWLTFHAVPGVQLPKVL